LNAAQIRKDLAYFGEFGVRGVGYYVAELKVHLRAILGLEKPVRVGILGAGNLGCALADYPGFRLEGFSIVALFDSDPSRIGGHSRKSVPILHVDQFADMARAGEIDIVVIAVPADAAQAVLDLAVAGGIRAVLNFSPGAIQVPAGVKVKNVDLTVSLESLSFFLARGDADDR
jgi:redox-sensing transcriptional repressor